MLVPVPDRLSGLGSLLFLMVTVPPATGSAFGVEVRHPAQRER